MLQKMEKMYYLPVRFKKGYTKSLATDLFCTSTFYPRSLNRVIFDEVLKEVWGTVLDDFERDIFFDHNWYNEIIRRRIVKDTWTTNKSHLGESIFQSSYEKVYNLTKL